jgi:O-antigen biosynthesis protein
MTPATDAPQFVIFAPSYIETSSGVRALHRLCHLLNVAGYRAAIRTPRGRGRVNPAWQTPLWPSEVAPEDAIVVYPEVKRGNPLQARRVVRWCLNYPGALSGDSLFARDEMVFAWDARMLERVGLAAGEPLDESRVLAVPVVDPDFIYPDAAIEKDVDCYFIYKGRGVRERFVLPRESEMVCIDDAAPTLRDLGRLLRRARRLYSYDHATLIFHEALICGCEIVQVHADGTLNDPRQCVAERRPCADALTTTWPGPDFVSTYAAAWSDAEPARRFARTVAARWPLS